MADTDGEHKRRVKIRASRFNGYEPHYFAKKHGLTIAQARALIARVGRDREALNRAGAMLEKKRTGV